MHGRRRAIPIITRGGTVAVLRRPRTRPRGGGGGGSSLGPLDLSLHLAGVALPALGDGFEEADVGVSEAAELAAHLGALDALEVGDLADDLIVEELAGLLGALGLGR